MSTQTINLSIDQINEIINQLNNSKSKKTRKGSFEKLPSGSYRFTYMYNSKKYRDTFSDIANDIEAEEKLQEWVEDIENGSYKKNTLTVSDFSQKWLDKQVRPNCSGDGSATKYANFLNNWFLPKYGNKKIRSIDVEEMTNYFNWLKAQKTKYTDRENHLLASGTLEKYHSILHAMFETAFLWGTIDSNPVLPKKKFNFNITVDGKPRISNLNTVNAKVEKEIDYYSYKEYEKALLLLDEDENAIFNNASLTEKEKHFQLGRLIAIELDFKTRT